VWGLPLNREFKRKEAMKNFFESSDEKNKKDYGMKDYRKGKCVKVVDVKIL
jgi:hypothetical protein